MKRVDYSDRDFNTNNGFTRMQKYVNGAYPDRVREHRQEMLEGIDPGYKNYREAAALTDFVFENLDYESRTPFWRPDFLLENDLPGNCEDHAVLHASLLSSAGFDVRYVVLEAEDEEAGHISTQVRFEDADLDELLNEARSIYQPSPERLGHETPETGEYWLHCDTVGECLVGITESPYFVADSDGEIHWKSDVAKDYLDLYRHL